MMTSPTDKKPGGGLLGWLGRQVGYVRQAVRTDVLAERKIYHKSTTQEAPLPGNPDILLRRTVIDEAVEKKNHA